LRSHDADHHHKHANVGNCHKLHLFLQNIVHDPVTHSDDENSNHYINYHDWYLHCKQHHLNHQLHRLDDAYRNLHEHHDLKKYVRIINKYLGHTNQYQQDFQHHDQQLQCGDGNADFKYFFK